MEPAAISEITGGKSREEAMSGARLKHYGWGREGEGMTAAEQTFVLGRYRAKFSRDGFEAIAVPRLEDLTLRTPRVAPPASLAAFCTSERYDRAAHAYGKSYPDYVRAMHRSWLPPFFIVRNFRDSRPHPKNILAPI